MKAAGRRSRTPADLSGDADGTKVHTRGCYPRLEDRQDPESLRVTATALFFAAAPLPTGSSGWYIYREVWLPSFHQVNLQVNLARIGEVWTSPCRESPRSPPRSQPGGPRKGLKLIPAASARLKMLEDCGPAGRLLRSGQLRGATQRKAWIDLRRTRLRAAYTSGRARQRALPCSKAPTRQRK